MSDSLILTPVDGAWADHFGLSVALSADGLTAIVGGPGDDVGGNIDQGSARVFAWNGTNWVQRGAALTPSDGAGADNFGSAVALSADGTTAIVGGVGDGFASSTSGEGSARVFVWDGTAWSQRGNPLTPSDWSYYERWGWSVSLADDGLSAIISTPMDNVGANTWQGSARIFDWTGSSWVQRGDLITRPSNIVNDEDEFWGLSSAISADGTIAIVGVRNDPINSHAAQGSGRVFVWNGNSWIQRGNALTPTDGAQWDYFGTAVAISDDGSTAIVGGNGDDIGLNQDQGSARVFVWNGTTWIQRGDAITPLDGEANDQWGQSVSLSANGLTVVIGGLDDVGTKEDQGSARVFDWTGTNPSYSLHSRDSLTGMVQAS